MRDMLRVNQINPAPLKMENINDYIVSAILDLAGGFDCSLGDSWSD